jgi:hypothetical protein
VFLYILASSRILHTYDKPIDLGEKLAGQKKRTLANASVFVEKTGQNKSNSVKMVKSSWFNKIRTGRFRWVFAEFSEKTT